MTGSTAGSQTANARSCEMTAPLKGRKKTDRGTEQEVVVTTPIGVCIPKTTIDALAGSWDLPTCFRILKLLTSLGSSRTCSYPFSYQVIIIIIIIDVCHIQYSFQTEVQ